MYGRIPPERDDDVASNFSAVICACPRRFTPQRNLMLSRCRGEPRARGAGLAAGVQQKISAHSAMRGRHLQTNLLQRRNTSLSRRV
jgi:hypothetical protein